MLLLNLLYFIILSLSVSYMWSYSEIMKPLREITAKITILNKPLLCSVCASFWFGLLISLLYNPVILDINIPFLTNIFCGLITHLFACFLYKSSNSKIKFI
jgi:hypothetical protein